MAILLAILTSAHAWAQTLVASAIKTTWLFTVLAAAVFSGCLPGCTLDVPASPQLDAGAPQRDAGLLPSPRALARGPYDAEGAHAWQQFSDLMLQSLVVATPNAHTWAIIVFDDYLSRDQVEPLLEEYELALHTVHASRRGCSFSYATYDVISDQSFADAEAAHLAAYFRREQMAADPSDACPATANLLYYAIVVESSVDRLLELRASPLVERITPVARGAGSGGIERPENRCRGCR